MEYKIDIILLTYNSLNNTKQCINHLYQFTDNFSIVILDNNSTDGTIDYLKELSKQKDNITLFLSNKNLGIINGRNKAYDLSKDSDYVCFIDNDQFVQEGWVDSYLSFIEKGFDIVGAEGWKVRKDFYPYKKAEVNESYNYVGCGGMVLKRKVIEDIGLFDPDFNPMYAEDPDFCWRAYDAGYKICWNTEKKIFHKPHKLLNAERRVYFNRSLNILRKKWSGKKIPILSNNIDK